MKIGLVRRGYSPSGGAERFLIRFAEGLHQLGHQAVLFTDCGWPPSAWDNTKHSVVALASSGQTLAPLAFADALQAVRTKEHCDFLFSFERVWACDAYRAGDGVHRAWLRRRACFEPAYKSWFRSRQKKHQQMLELEAALYAPESGVRIVANSQMVKREIAELYGKEEDQITVIANGYDAQECTPEQRVEWRRKKREDLALQDDQIAVLFAGSGWERKGLPFAMQAFKQWNLTGDGSGKKARLLVAGRGKSPRNICTERVQFLGEQESLTRLYEAADIFILPTLYDPFSNACLEAAAHGLPVITTNANGFADIMNHAQQGVTVEAGEVAAMAAALQAFAESANGSNQMNRAEIRSWAAAYTVARNVQSSLDFIKTV